MFDYQAIYHSGVLVPDIDEAMVQYGAALGLTWASVQHADDRQLWTPECGAHTAPLTYVYSCEGPQHIELLCGGSVWACGDRPGLHHVGVWSSDIAADAARCTAAGWTVTSAAAPPEDGYGGFAYVQSPTGMIVELVAERAKARFEAWWAGGSMGSDRK